MVEHGGEDDPIDPPLQQHLNRVAFDPNGSSIVYVALFGYGIWRRGDAAHDGDSTSFHQVFATKFPNDTTGDRRAWNGRRVGGSISLRAGHVPSGSLWSR